MEVREVIPVMMMVITRMMTADCGRVDTAWWPVGEDAWTRRRCQYPAAVCPQRRSVARDQPAAATHESSLFLEVSAGSRYVGYVSIVRRFDSPKIQLKLKLALTPTLTLTDTGDLRTIEPSDYRADTGMLCVSCILVHFDKLHVAVTVYFNLALQGYDSLMSFFNLKQQL